MMPREHGSWAVLIAPILVGLAAAGGGPPSVAGLFCVAALGGFLLRVPLQSLFSASPAPKAAAWAVVYAALAAAGGGPLLWLYGRWGLLGFAFPAAILTVLNIRANLARRTLSLANELSAILVLCLGAPAACYALGGGLPPEAWQAWVLCALYFIGPVFDVKAAALRHRAAAGGSWVPEWESMRRRSVAYHAAAFLAVVAGALLGLAPAVAPLAFLAVLHKTWRRALLAPGRVDFRRLGYQEVAYSVLFTLLLALGWGLRLR